jgi:hypothetical protein
MIVTDLLMELQKNLPEHDGKDNVAGSQMQGFRRSLRRCGNGVSAG